MEDNINLNCLIGLLINKNIIKTKAIAIMPPLEKVNKFVIKQRIKPILFKELFELHKKYVKKIEL